MSRTLQAAAWLLLLLTISALYWPGLRGPMVFDDISNIVFNTSVKIADLSPASLRQAALSGGATEFRRPLSMLTFGINYALTQGDVYYFKLTNLAIHLVNVLLIGSLTLRLLRRYPAFDSMREQAPAIAWMTAAAWGLHPLQVSTVYYVVQRMTELSALFTLAALLTYVAGRERQQRGGTGGGLLIAIAALVLTPLSFACKETGILFFAYVVVIEIFAGSPDRFLSIGVRRTIAAVIAVGVAAGVAYLISRQTLFAGSFAIKGFSAFERMLTEPRVLFWYAWMIVYPDVRQMGLVHDDWQVSSSLLEPLSTLPALALLLAILGALPWLRRRLPIAAFCLAWFLAGHSLEAGPWPLDLAYEHRNYLPSFSVFLGLVLAGSSGLARSERLGRSAPLIALSFLLTLGAITGLRVHEWKSYLQWSVAQTQHHPNSGSGFLDLGAVYADLAETESDAAARKQWFERADAAFLRAFELNPRIVNGPISRITLRLRTGRTVAPEMLEPIVEALRTKPIRASSQIAVTQLFVAAIREQLPLTSTQLMSLLNAALANPECPSEVSSQLLGLAADFQGLREHNVKMAMTLAQAATEVPGAAVETRLTLAYWMAVAGYRSRALEALAELDRLDSFKEFSATRDRLAQLIEAGRVGPDAATAQPRLIDSVK